MADEPAPSGPDADSVWSDIEQASGIQLDDDARAAAQELSDERFDEERFLGLGSLRVEPDPSLYLDPVEALAADPLHLKQVAPGEFDIPVVVNASVEKWLRYFTGNGRKWYVRYLERMPRYEDLIYEKMDAAGLPRDLIYLAMAESGFSNTARSHASAVGLWQFMAPTARGYDMRVDYWVDERVDPGISTDAAIAYLSDLYRLQGDWYLAWASYNAGPGRVNAAIRKHGTRNWWVIAAQDTLAAETCNYPSKILAAAIIGKHPERYGFTDLTPADPLQYEVVDVAGGLSLELLARTAGTDLTLLQELNPGLLRGVTPPDVTTELRLPVGTLETFTAAYPGLSEQEKVSYRRHVVREGESLGTISDHYGVSVDTLVRLNRLSNPNRIYPGMELVINLPPGTEPPAAAATVTTTHTVQGGETLEGIATRYGVTVSQLVSWNSLSNANHIQPGQKLTVKGGSPKSTAAMTYTVQSGDTLSQIAERFGVSTADVMSWNGVSDPSHIQVGQRLKLYAPAAQWVTYEVRTGDSLGGIAQKHGCTVADLKSWNDLESTTIQPGQKLRIRDT